MTKIINILKSIWRDFVVDECFLRASALTFYTLLSVIPILAVAFGIAKGFGFEENMQREVLWRFRQQPEVANMIIDFTYSLLKHTQGGIIAGIGLIVLLWSVLKLLGNIESSLNAIWKVPNSRHFLRQFSDYLAIMVLCPIFFVISSSITILITTELRHLAQQDDSVAHIVSPLLVLTYRSIPYILSSILFTLIYLVMPNTRVNLKAGIIAGIVAGSIYQMVQWIYIHFQIGVASYGAIYGSFAALPLFLIWIHVSWLIVLAGAELAFHIESSEASYLGRAPRVLASMRIVAILMMQKLAEQFVAGKGPSTLANIAHDLGVSLTIVRRIAARLVDAGLLSEMKNEQFQPARDVRAITIHDITKAIELSQRDDISIFASKEYDDAKNLLKSYDTSLNQGIIT